MPIRIKCRDKPRDRTQPTEDTGLIAALADDPETYYTGSESSGPSASRLRTEDEPHYLGESPMSTANPHASAFEQFYKIALEYYVGGRAALLSGNSLITGNLLHHGVEMLLKGQLSKTVPLKHLKDQKKFGHKLSNLWPAFKGTFPSGDLTEFDTMIDELDKFEKIRYPDEILAHGASIAVGFGRGQPATSKGPGRTEPAYQIGVGDVDAFFARLLPLCGLNPKAYIGFLTRYGRDALTDGNNESKNWLA